MNNQYNYQADDRIRQQQAKVQEVVGIMKDNVNLVLERETRLAEIDTRADELQVQSKQFQAVAGRVRRKYFWQNMKFGPYLTSIVEVINPKSVHELNLEHTSFDYDCFIY
ncbi:Vesicle-associated membrane protein 3, variant 2 [Schistosoma haematobium]|uniref:Vesicle-associated membrane protein 3, variant 2 n=1 Tax=Schistosoma haematobium TaxID=6185 RepID=A0A922S5R3_SCHHA|nr:Vesicle-associated membrane protein 3, variant 2 [Schistosoma haematobium]KAH9594902.1 Vesicle-associated membrane protein 3, variant 2 [Schistosoma haematobium]